MSQRTKFPKAILAFSLAGVAAAAALTVTALFWEGLAGNATAIGDGGVSAFYRWDEAIPEEPGRILRAEPLPADIRIAGAAEQTRILYSSTSGIDGEPTTISGMLFMPEGEPPRDGWPLLAWAHGTTGVADFCAPSWAGPGPVVERYLKRWLDEGYAVVATDYEGLGTASLHLYLAKRAEAHSVLDGIRAALDARHDITDDVVIAGQSQGGGAAFASVDFAPDYAPELKIRGAIASGLPYFTPGLPTASGVAAERVDPGLAYVFYVALVAQALDEQLKASHLFSERALPVFEEAATTCIGDLKRRVREAELTQANALQPAAIKRMAETLLPHYVYPTLKLGPPLFVATGTEDRDVDPRGQLMLVRHACAAGTVVQAHLYAGKDHIGAWLASQEEALAFARAVRKGQPVTPECTPEATPAP